MDTRKRQIRADGVLIVADGMGGRSFGEQAAAAAVETAEDALAELLDNRQVGDVEVADALATALRRANARVYALASEGDDRKGMGTTCVAAVVEGDRLYVAHAGDSRAYLLRDGVLRQVTHDHSYVAEQVRAGTITEEGARSSRFRNIITRAVGIEPTLDAEVSEADVQPGDTVLLCTDGLSNMVAEDDMVRALTQAASPQAAADRLVGMAVKSGGRDNVTAIVARLQAGTRTLKMQVADLVREGRGDEAAGEAPAHANGRGASRAYPRPRRAVFWPLAAGVLLLALLAAGTWGTLAAQTLTHAGYTLRLTPPYAVRPVPPPPPLPPDPAHVAYGPPKLFYPHPVRGDFLIVNPVDGTVTVAAVSGAVLGLSPSDASLRYKYALPFFKPLPSASKLPVSTTLAPTPPVAFGSSAPSPIGFGGVTLHTATDPQGNLYVSSAVAKTVTKYTPNGTLLGLAAHSGLKNPQAVGAAADGTVYLVDGGRLLVLHARPSSAPLPPVPVIAPPKPAALPASPPAAPLPAFRHSFRHYGYRR